MSTQDDQNSKPQQGTHFFLAAIVLAVAIWPIGFNLGAYGTVFFGILLQVWVMSLAALLAGLLVNKSRDNDVLTRTDVVLLALPSLWLLSNMLRMEYDSTAVRWLNDALMLATAFFSIPHIIHIVMPIAMPQVTDVRGTRRTLHLAVLTVVIAAASFAIGYRNDLFMTCADFEVADNAEPTNCRHSPRHYDHGTFKMPD